LFCFLVFLGVVWEGFGIVLRERGLFFLTRPPAPPPQPRRQSDYGRPEQNEEEFRVLASYSPLHNVALPEQGKGQYPAIVLATGDHDDRVVPLHSIKLLAALQCVAAQASPSPQRNPIIGRIEVRAGHGAGKPTGKIIAETSDLFAFAAGAVGATWHDDEDDGAA
jgi:prolyl oligopeptidase